MASRPDVVDHFKRKFFQRFIDPDFEVVHMSSTTNTQTARASSSSTSSTSPDNSAMNSTVFPIAQQLPGVGGFPDSTTINSTLASGSSNASFLNVPNNTLLLHGQQSMLNGRLGNQTSVRMTAGNTQPFDMSVAVSCLPDHGRCKHTWQNVVSSGGYSTNPLHIGATFNCDNSSPAKPRRKGRKPRRKGRTEERGTNCPSPPI